MTTTTIIIIFLANLLGYWIGRSRGNRNSESVHLTEDQIHELKAIDEAYRKEMARTKQCQKEHNKTIDKLNYWKESVMTDNLKDKHDY